ncbi:MAG TPA: hypothetical protein VH138_02075 [Vicinamibacterales bacterium]|jgi:hypothetical protein|nr:hypothetical protein [Vicinamibacterales bacterium]
MTRILISIAGSVALLTAAAPQSIDLAAQLAAGKLHAVNRDVTNAQGRPGAVHVSEKADPGLVWIEGVSFTEGAIEIDVRGRDVMQRSFLGLAFHGKDDQTYECVYLRPFNFRAEEAARKHHAAQYMVLPSFDWPKLREQFPEEFEGGVDQAILPTDWLTLKIVVKALKVQAYAGSAAAPILDVRKLGDLPGGRIALWTGNNSDGDFANLRITPAS